MPKVLLIEDAVDIVDLVLLALGELYSVTVAAAKSDALKLLECERFDLVILDVQLPDGDGFQLCAELKSNGHWHGMPVIFLTAKSSVEDKILGFAVGADDYVVKPFDTRELMARVQSKLRNAETLRRGKRVADLWLDFERQAAYVCQGDRETQMDLTTTEFRLLAFLVQNEGLILHRDRILDSVWGTGRYLGDRSVDVYISSLRRKMKGMRCSIKTIYKAGYSFSSVPLSD
ncbi:MAG: response regulator transcription factor [Bdellovibrionales bacterium]